MSKKIRKRGDGRNTYRSYRLAEPREASKTPQFYKVLNLAGGHNPTSKYNVIAVVAKTDVGEVPFLAGFYDHAPVSKYMPHQGTKECARRRRQLGL